jgi:hypothetical protein
MAYQNLRFFDSNSDQLNLVYNTDLNIFEGNVYLPTVSTGLYETVTIYALEEVEGSLGDIKLVTPIAETTGTVQFKYEFEGGYRSSESIFLYNANAVDGTPYVDIVPEQYQTLLSQSYYTGLNTNGLKITNSAKPVPLISTIALNSDSEGFFIRTLNIYILVDGVQQSQIAKIKIYGEVEAEDERLPVLLSNIGLTIDELDYYIFKESDIKEGSPDHILLNEKRKELLLQASEIKPFIGTYKALLHAIDFFGYSNITLKEYWLNVNEQSENFGKLKAVAIPNQETIGFLADKNKSTELPNSNHKKTSRFSLVYRLNVPNGEYDEWDIPKVEESMDFSPDEVLIKLYGLKNKLQRDFLPLQAKIVDITGEGDYFSQMNQNVWSNQHVIKNQEAGREFESVKVPADRTLFIEDLRLVDYRLTGKDQDFDSLTQNDREEITSSIESFYSNYNTLDLSTYNTMAGIPIGAPLVLKVEGLEDLWSEAEFSWMDAEDTGNHLLTWQNWWHRGIYEIEWVISGPRNYLRSFRGAVDEYNNFPMTLPYSGTYNVEANLYDLYNVKSTKIKKEWIEVRNKNVEVYGLTQIATKQLSWSEYNYSWKEAGSSWEWSRENTLPVSDTVGTFYHTMDRANYINDSKDGSEFSIVRRYLDTGNASGFSETAGPYQWSELKTQSWSDGPEVTWKMTRVGSDVNSSFKIDIRQSLGYTNDYLIIAQVNGNAQTSDVYLITSTYPTDETDLTAWQNVADELNSLDPIDHPILSKFNYNPLFLDSDNDPLTGTGPQGTDECYSILAVAKEPSRNFDFDAVQFATPVGGSITNKVNFTSYNPDFEDTYIIREMSDLHMLNHVTFSYDLTNMPGITSQKWRLINNTLNKEDIYYNNQWLTYLFKHKGYYTIELELADLNGNTNKVTKNILNII